MNREEDGHKALHALDTAALTNQMASHREIIVTNDICARQRPWEAVSTLHIYLKIKHGTPFILLSVLKSEGELSEVAFVAGAVVTPPPTPKTTFPWPRL